VLPVALPVVDPVREPDPVSEPVEDPSRLPLLLEPNKLPMLLDELPKEEVVPPKSELPEEELLCAWACGAPSASKQAPAHSAATTGKV
jgi:hypothetical protein